MAKIFLGDPAAQTCMRIQLMHRARRLLGIARRPAVICQVTLDKGNFTVNMTDNLSNIYHACRKHCISCKFKTRYKYLRCQAANCQEKLKPGQAAARENTDTAQALRTGVSDVP